jgi:hypothetical protein
MIIFDYNKRLHPDASKLGFGVNGVDHFRRA